MFQLLPQLATFLVAEGVQAFLGHLSGEGATSQQGESVSFDQLLNQVSQDDESKQLGLEWLQGLQKLGLNEQEIQELGRRFIDAAAQKGEGLSLSEATEMVSSFLDEKKIISVKENITTALQNSSKTNETESELLSMLSQDEGAVSTNRLFQPENSSLLAKDSSLIQQNLLGASSTPIGNTLALMNQQGLRGDIVSPGTKSIDLNASIFQPVEWSEKFGEQISWLSNQQLKTASIKLNPPELGPMEVSIKLVQDQATVHINSHSVQVRDLIEQAIPKLREMLEQQGLNLADVNVSDSSKHNTGQQDASPAYLNDERLFAEGQNIAQQSVITKLPQGLVDYFA